MWAQQFSRPWLPHFVLEMGHFLISYLYSISVSSTLRNCFQTLKIVVIILGQVDNDQSERGRDAVKGCMEYSKVSTSELIGLRCLICSIVGCELGVICLEKVIYFLIQILGGVSELSFWVTWRIVSCFPAFLNPEPRLGVVMHLILPHRLRPEDWEFESTRGYLVAG